MFFDFQLFKSFDQNMTTHDVSQAGTPKTYAVFAPTNALPNTWFSPNGIVVPPDSTSTKRK